MIRKEHLKKLFSYPFWVHLLLALCMFAAIWLTYKDCLSARFQLDDGLRIANNTHVHMKEFSFKRWVTEPFRDQAKRRWFAMMTISLNYYFAWLKPFYYRLVNVFIHMGSALFFYLLLVQTFRIARGGFKREDETFIRIAAFFSTMIWALHPLQTSAVTYIIQRMTSLSGMLYLAALLLYVHGRKRKGLKRWLCYGGCFVVAVLAVGSKEPAIMIVATIPLYEFYFFRDLQFSKNPEKNRKAVYIFLGGGLVVFALVLWQGNYLVKLIGLSYERYDFDMYQRLLSQPRILVYYLSLIFWPRPHRICTDPSFMAHSSSLFHPWTTLPAFLFLGLYLYIAFFLRKKQKLLSFGMFWLLINLLVEQSFIPLQLLFHHRLYLPVTFFIAGLVFSFSEWARSLRLTSPALVAGSAVIALLVGSIIVTTVVRVSSAFELALLGGNFTANLLSWLMTFITMLSFYRWLPTEPVRWKHAAWGALWAAIGWQSAVIGFSWYLGSGFAHYDLIYGTLSTVIVLLFWIYISSMIILFGAHITAALCRRPTLKF